MNITTEIAKFFLKTNNANDYFIKKNDKWYFSDETWTEWIGSYPTREKCFEGFTDYCKGL